MDQVTQGGEKGVKGLITRRSHGCCWCYLVERQSSGQGYVRSGLLASGLGSCLASAAGSLTEKKPAESREIQTWVSFNFVRL